MDHPHVHFEAADVVAHDNSIIVQQPEEGRIDIHVGFLQVLHKYEVNVTIPAAFLPHSEKIIPQELEIPNLIVRYEQKRAPF